MTDAQPHAERGARRTGLLSLTPAAWRADLLRVSLRFFAVFGTFAYLPSVYLSLRFPQYAVALIDTLALGLIFALHFARRASHGARAALLCLGLYGLGAGLLVNIGSISQIYLIGFSILTTLLLSHRWGLASVALNTVTMFALGVLGAVAPEMLSSRWAWGPGGWAVVTLNFTLINGGVVLVIGGVLGALERALALSTVARDALAAEQASLRESRALLRIAGESARLGGWRVDLGAQREQWSDELCALCELPAGTFPTMQDALAFFVPERRVEVREAFWRCVREGQPFDLEAQIVTARGTRRWVRVIGNAAHDDRGAITHAHGSVQDVTAQHLAQQQHERLEEQLRQAQKMESIGSLAGGIAHDFNNLMSVVLSYSELLLEQLEPGDPMVQDLDEIRQAGERAATLTRQLLAFSRQQVLEPEVVHLDRIVAGMEKLLRRLIGEDVELTCHCPPGLGPVLIDPGQLEQVIMNLVVNARDAMPRGGRITLETSEVSLDEAWASEHDGVTAGRHALLRVTDTGTGIDPAVQARIFEPFFTTKDKGKGTGLGLATVFGIVRQSGGTISFTSAQGQGTSFAIHLPVAVEDVRTRAAVHALGSDHLRGQETLLLVEDEEELRTLARTILTRFGYSVLEAQNGGEALLLCEQHQGPIDLLLTDVVMPRMSGRQLAERLAPLRPQMRVLYMSGYTDDAVVRHGVMAATIAFLQKPITPEPLARKVREVLDAAPVGATG